MFILKTHLGNKELGFIFYTEQKTVVFETGK